MKRTIVKAMSILAFSVIAASCGSDEAKVIDNGTDTEESSDLNITGGQGSGCIIVFDPGTGGHCTNDPNAACAQQGIRRCPRPSGPVRPWL